MNEIAEVIERLENLIAAMTLPVPDDIHLTALRKSIPEIKDELKSAYLSMGGEDVWDI